MQVQHNVAAVTSNVTSYFLDNNYAYKKVQTKSTFNAALSICVCVYRITAIE